MLLQDFLAKKYRSEFQRLQRPTFYRTLSHEILAHPSREKKQPICYGKPRGSNMSRYCHLLEDAQ